MDSQLVAELVMNTLHKAGFEAYLVGGCVRDSLLNRGVSDYDVTTNASPEQVTFLFEKTVQVGAKFGVVVVVDNGVETEVATYRADGNYSDGRRPDEIHYSSSAKEDVIRRDFTMNGLLMVNEAHTRVLPEDALLEFISNDAVVLDYVGGLVDIQNKVIRCIGDPNKRFEEDALRMLRAARFTAQLGFEIESGTLNAIVADADSIKSVSKERVSIELKKLTTSKYAVKGLTVLVTSGLFRRIFPVSFVEKVNTARMLERFAQNHTSDPTEGLAMLLADCNDRDAVAEAIDNFKLSREESDTLRDATYFRPSVGFLQGMDEGNVRLFARTNGLVPYGVNLFAQDLGLAMYRNVGLESGMDNVLKLRSYTHEDLYPTPFVTGKDLIEMGFKPGPLFTKVLKAVEFGQLNGDLTTREQALGFAKFEAGVQETVAFVKSEAEERDKLLAPLPKP